MIKQYKRKKIKDNLDRHQANPSKFWNEIRKIIPKDTPPEVVSLVDEETGVSYTSSQLSDHINEYFAAICEKLARNIQNRHGNRTIYQPYLNAHNDGADGITNIDFTVNELRTAMKKININKSSAVRI